MDTSPAAQSALYEQAILRIVRGLPVERMAEVLDFAMFVKTRESAITSPETVLELEERTWGQTAVQSLAKYWDTPEEDEAWAHLQEAT